MSSHFRLCRLAAIALAALAGCTQDYSPNTYSSNAVQQANKVEPAVVIGYRQVSISASGTVGAVTGGAAGGVLGSQATPGGITSALGAVGGTLVGTLVGTTVEHVTGDTTGWEYIVRKPNGDMLSVTQREPTPLPIGQKVLVISGNQARIIPDYSVAVDPPPPSAPAAPTGGERPGQNAKEAQAAVPNPASAASSPASSAAPAAAEPAPSPAPSASTADAAPAESTAEPPASPATEPAAPAPSPPASSAVEPQPAAAATPDVPPDAPSGDPEDPVP